MTFGSDAHVPEALAAKFSGSDRDARALRIPSGVNVPRSIGPADPP